MANTYGSSNSKRGFASMSKDRVKEIASMGGQPHISRVLPMNLIQQKLEKLVVAGVVLLIAIASPILFSLILSVNFFPNVFAMKRGLVRKGFTRVIIFGYAIPTLS